MSFNNQAKAREILARSPWCSQQDALKAWDEAVALLSAPATPWTGEGLPPSGSTVRIVNIGLPVWPEAEKFFGADCTLCAVFMTGDTQMVAVEHQADAVCCCFRADMVRTPEQIEQQELREALEELAPHIAGYMGRDDPGSVDVGLAAYLLDHGYRKQPSP